MEIDVGQTIAGKYELVRLLGKGAIAEVWAARHLSLGTDVAIKLIVPPVDDDIALAERFRFEAQIVARLSRKTAHIVSVIDHGSEDGVYYLVMEMLEGISLDTQLREGPLSPEDAVEVVRQIACGLEVAHGEGVIHRDLKPANIWLGRHPNGQRLVKLLDFGIARAARPLQVRAAHATGRGIVLGTPTYMSPEQARGLESLDARCDVWALAVVAYEALCLAPPFDGPTTEDLFLAICTFRYEAIHTHQAALPASLDGFFAKAFAKDIDERFQSPMELAHELAWLLADGERGEKLPALAKATSDWEDATTPLSAGRVRTAGPPSSSRGSQGNTPAASPRKGRTRSTAFAIGLVTSATALLVAARWTSRIPPETTSRPSSRVDAGAPEVALLARTDPPEAAATAADVTEAAAAEAVQAAGTKPAPATKQAPSSPKTLRIQAPATSASVEMAPPTAPDKSEVF